MVIELLCPVCGDTWQDEYEYIEEIEDIERFCKFCDYFGIPEKNIISDYEIQKFYMLVCRLSEKLKVAEVSSVKSE